MDITAKQMASWQMQKILRNTEREDESMEEDKNMEEIKDLIKLLKYEFKGQENPYILAYRERDEEWCTKFFGDPLDFAVGVASAISDVAEIRDIEIGDILAAISELAEAYNDEKRNKKDIKETQKKICPLCSMDYGEGEDYCGYGDTCELIKRIREGKKV